MVRGGTFFEKCKLFFRGFLTRPEKHVNPPWTTPPENLSPWDHAQMIERKILFRIFTKEARAGDTTRFEAALDSGAHFISTDYYLPGNKFGTNYRVQLPTQTSVRFNPNFFSDNLSSSLLE